LITFGGVLAGARNPVPGDGVEAGKAARRNGRHVRHDRRALFARHRQSTQRSGLQVRQHADGIAEHHVPLPADQVGDRERGAAIGHMRHLQAGLAAEQLGDEMIGRADAGCAVVQ
jgi:hypothetical protein